ncbi:hypothetical protein [Natrialba sp. PRR66]|nr:hypothetical protein [Natrialba sp. PRR66]
MDRRISRLLAGERSTPPELPNFDPTTVFIRTVGIDRLGNREH